MATIVKITQVFLTNSGSDTSRAFFELQTSDAKKALLQRKSKFDPNVYFVPDTSTEITSVPGVVSTVISTYETAWADLAVGITLTGDGALPSSFNEQPEFKNAVFSVAGKTGLVTVNGYNMQTGGFDTVAAAASTAAPTAATGSGATTQTTKTGFFSTPVGKVVAWVGLAIGATTALVFGVRAYIKNMGKDKIGK